MQAVQYDIRGTGDILQFIVKNAANQWLRLAANALFQPRHLYFWKQRLLRNTTTPDCFPFLLQTMSSRYSRLDTYARILRLRIRARWIQKWRTTLSHIICRLQRRNAWHLMTNLSTMNGQVDISYGEIMKNLLKVMIYCQNSSIVYTISLNVNHEKCSFFLISRMKPDVIYLRVHRHVKQQHKDDLRLIYSATSLHLSLFLAKSCPGASLFTRTVYVGIVEKLLALLAVEKGITQIVSMICG